MALEQTERVAEGWTRVGSLAELKARGPLVGRGGRHGVALFYNEGRVFAVDNRCPHMGFPLHMGSVDGCILTCHWHHARFDLAGGGTFDPFADDLRTYPVRLDGDDILIDLRTDVDGLEQRWRRRLHEGLEQNLGLVIAKAVIALLELGVEPGEIVQIGAEHATRYRRDGFGPGLTILTAMANVLPLLRDEDRAHALYQGLRHIAAECSGSLPRFPLDPLPASSAEPARLQRWLRDFIEVRNADGAERTLQTAVTTGASPRALADMLHAAAMDHVFLSGGHVLDFQNKAFELLEHIGWERADAVLPALLRQLAGAQRSEEQNAWRHPVDLIALQAEACRQLPESSPPVPAGSGDAATAGGTAMAAGAARLDQEILLGDDPRAIVTALSEALADGLAPGEAARDVALAAAARIAHFNTQNEFGDWITVLHTFTYCNALQRALQRAPSVMLVRGIYHGALRVYLDRFLNVPPARLPEPGAAVGAGGAGVGAAGLQGAKSGDAMVSKGTMVGPGGDGDAAEFRLRFLELLDAQQQVKDAAALAAAFLDAGGDEAAFWRTLGEALLREDAEFHTFQMFEAGLSQWRLWPQGSPQRRLIALATVRYLAGHSPTPRESPKVADIALRLHKGEKLFEE